VINRINYQQLNVPVELHQLKKFLKTTPRFKNIDSPEAKQYVKEHVVSVTIAKQDTEVKRPLLRSGAYLRIRHFQLKSTTKEGGKIRA